MTNISSITASNPASWVSYMDKLEFPVPKEEHSIIMGPRPGKDVGLPEDRCGFSTDIKTKYGWLMIYHGVDKERVYRLGVMLVPLDNPERVIYRSPNPILSPETEHEIAYRRKPGFPNVSSPVGQFLLKTRRSWMQMTRSWFTTVPQTAICVWQPGMWAT